MIVIMAVTVLVVMAVLMVVVVSWGWRVIVIMAATVLVVMAVVVVVMRCLFSWLVHRESSRLPSSGLKLL